MNNTFGYTEYLKLMRDYTITQIAKEKDNKKIKELEQQLSKIDEFITHNSARINKIESTIQENLKKQKQIEENLKKQKQIEESIIVGESLTIDAPTYNENTITDKGKGLWLLWDEKLSTNKNSSTVLVDHEGQKVFARNPYNDILNDNVAIDFGTSSTVVAIRSNGKKTPIRIGTLDFSSTVSQNDFENPTCLEFCKVNNLVTALSKEKYHPNITKRDLKCSRNAKNEIMDRDNVNPKCLQGSILNIKSWAYKNYEKKIDLIDTENQEEFFISGTENIKEKVFNPITLYAFFIGVTLNNQYTDNGRIYKNYYLTFPVKYTRKTRDFILESFRAGLLMSLPRSLQFTDWQDSDLVVREGESEPTAYLASFINSKQIEITEKEQAVAVFDFGGGTTDFSMAMCRYSTDEEQEDNNCDYIMNLIDTSGDSTLGGEHLVELLVYETVKQNIELLKKEGIVFSLPVDKSISVGEEAVFESSVSARSNTILLGEALRPIWETPDKCDDKNLKSSFNFFDKHNQPKTETKLTINAQHLKDTIKSRVSKGIETFLNFCSQALKAYKIKDPTASFDKLHIVLAGNSCRSQMVYDIFQEKATQETNKTNTNDCLFEIYKPITESIDNGLNLKTGVALGLLDILPGESILVQKTEELSGDIFNFYVGKFKRGILTPELSRGFVINKWMDFGKVPTSQTLIIGYTDNPNALNNSVMRGDVCCKEYSISFNSEDCGKYLKLRPISTDEVEIGVCNANEEEPTSYTILKLQTRN